MDLSLVIARPVEVAEQTSFQHLMARHHYMGSLPKIGNTVRYVALCEDQWLAVLCFSAAALKCGVRDRWIGWDLRQQYDRHNLIANHPCFLVLPQCHHRNLASKGH